MSQKYAIHKFDFMYNDEWYDADRRYDTLYHIADDEVSARQYWAALERDSLAEFELENLSTFNNGELSEAQYRDIVQFITNDCGLPLAVEDDGFFYPEEVPLDSMNDEQLLTFLQLAQSNHYILKPYISGAPRYVIYTQERGYLLQDPSGYSESIWFTHDGNEVIAQYCSKMYCHQDDLYDKQTQLTEADLQNPIVQSLINQPESGIRIDYNADKTQGTIYFEDCSSEVVTALNAVLQWPSYKVQQVDDVAFTKISQNPYELLRD